MNEGMVEGLPMAAGSRREVLRGIEMRPFLPSERGQWDAPVNAHHYLELPALVRTLVSGLPLFANDLSHPPALSKPSPRPPLGSQTPLLWPR